jgi:hypothetical protein
VELRLNETHQLLVYADDVNLLGDYADTIKKNTQTLIDASKEFGLEVNTEETTCMLQSVAAPHLSQCCQHHFWAEFPTLF